MGVSLTRKSIFGLKVEATEGAAETLAAADFALNCKNQSDTHTPGEYSRETQRATLTKLAMVKGTRLGEVSGQVEMVGGAAGTEPVWGRILRACGMAPTTLKMVTIASAVAFVPGQIVGDNTVQASATKTGRVIAVIGSTTTKRLVYEPITGVLADTDTLYNYDTPQLSVAVDSAPADAGRVYKFLSEGVSSVPSYTVERRRGGKIVRLVGARGTASIELVSNSVPLLNVTLTGSPVLDTDGELIDDPADLGTITYPAVVPLPNQSMPVRIGEGATQVTPVLTEIRVDLANTVTPRETISDSDFVESGHRGVRITDRAPVWTMNPEREVGDTLDVVRRTFIGTVFKTYCQYGRPGNGNGMLSLIANAGQLSGAASPGDRNGIETADLNIMLTGDADDELYVAHYFPPNS